MRNLFADWDAANLMSLHTESCTSRILRDKGISEFALPSRAPLWTLPKSAFTYLNLERETFEGVFTFQPTTRLIESIERFAPQVVYTQLGPPYIMKLVHWIVDRYKLPLIVHVMDDFIADWPVSGHKLRRWLPFSRKMRATAERHFKWCLSSAQKRLAISPAMAVEYEKRYHMPFEIFSNAVNVDRWQRHKFGRHVFSDHKFVLTYIGSIAKNTNLTSLVAVARAVAELKKNGKNINFIVVSQNYPSFIKEHLEKFDGVEFCDAIPFDEVPEFLAGADMALLPFDFNDLSRRFCRLSWPTKLSEYMASGCPILYFGPADSGFAKYLEDNNCAILVKESNTDRLISIIRECMANEELRARISTNALMLAKAEFNSVQVRQRVTQIIAESVVAESVVHSTLD